MQLVVAGGLSGTFRKGANEEAYRRLMWQHRQQQERTRRQKQQEVEQGESDLVDLAGVIITAEQAQLFQAELNIYNEANYEALRENEERLEGAKARLQRTLERAHVLDDGRRVFKTEDGLRVFDENGREVEKSIIAPDDIPDSKPTWEQFLQDKNLVRELIQQREELLEFQSNLDEAQELLDSGQMTQGQFDKLRAKLAANAPDAVKARVQEISMDEATDLSSSTSAPEIDLDAELSGMMPIPKPFVPGAG